MSITPEIDLETYDTPHCPECFTEIDTWAVEKRAIQAERERIIQLLEEAEPCECNPSWSYRCDTHFRIALIKGEEQ